jgi:DNA-binding MarR family transcriptional regulator
MAQVSKMAQTMASDCAAHRIRQAARVLTRAYDESVRSLGIQVSQLFVLVAVANAGQEGAPIGQIAKALLMDQTTVSRNVVPLEKSGLLKRAHSERDARARVVHLTAAGLAMIEAAYPRWKATQRKLKRTLGVDRFDALCAELSGVVRMANELE